MLYYVICKESHNVWYALLGFCRPIKGICGLTREIIVGLVANLETCQQRREEYTERDLPPEHPRASSTDDVEGIIALFHEVIGVIFDTKEFLDEFPKIMNEFSKKSDPDLPFYYWTGSQTGYRGFPLPSFYRPSKEGVERLDKLTLSRRGDPGVFVADVSFETIVLIIVPLFSHLFINFADYVNVYYFHVFYCIMISVT